MLLGFNMLLWSTHIGQDEYPILETLKKTGYDGVELPLFDGTPEDRVELGQVLKDNGLRATAVAIIPDKAHDTTSPDRAARAAGLAHLKWAIDCLAAAGGEVLCGPFYQPLAQFSGNPPTEDELGGIVEVHKEAARHAARSGIKLSVEPLNRFECYALNTVAAAASIVRQVDESNYGLLYDTFHANIEEKDPVGVIAPHLPWINHVHTAENDRGTPGKGHVPWASTMKALKQGQYDGWYVIEAFGRSLPAIAAATRVWRDFFPDKREVYEYGHDFLREQWRTA